MIAQYKYTRGVQTLSVFVDGVWETDVENQSLFCSPMAVEVQFLPS